MATATTSTSATAKRSPDAKPRATLLHQEKVNDVVVSFFDDERSTIQRRYFKPDSGGKADYANSLRPKDWKDARLALEQLDHWYADYVNSKSA